MKDQNNNIINNSQFYQLVDDLFLKIEDTLDIYSNKIDIDYEIQNYVFTIEFNNKSIIIINKQEFFQQIWLATSINGYHFNHKDNIWICTRSYQDFWKIFSNACSIQSNTNLNFISHYS
ncbi:iron donor protein CyaY [Buchnera aphidicola]|uniref:iron donor protein CyaY n=1 Tax=Buchnera aphidicola TaxID=9 RepID=UPI003BEEFFD2